MKSRAGSLLKSVIDSAEITADDIARELKCSGAELESYAKGDVAMPLPRQLALALLLIARSKRFKRSGHSLRAQVAAAADFHDHTTSVHNEPPTSWAPNPRRRTT